jgi:molecular chaperone GrpE
MAEPAGGPQAGPGSKASPPPARPRPPAAAGSGHEAAAPGQSPQTDGQGGGGEAAAAAARIAELEDERLRALADLDNLRKRCAAEVSRTRAEAQAGVAAQWLPVVDNLERALAHAQADPAAIIEGVRAVRDQAVGLLAQLGYARREDLGAVFDPARHEAIATRPAQAEPDGSVVEVVRPAYGEGERQLRPAQVVVAKAD